MPPTIEELIATYMATYLFDPVSPEELAEVETRLGVILPNGFVNLIWPLSML